MKAAFNRGYRRSPRHNRLSAHVGYGNLMTCGDAQASGPRLARCGSEVAAQAGGSEIREFGTRVGTSRADTSRDADAEGRTAADGRTVHERAARGGRGIRAPGSRRRLQEPGR